MGSRAAVAMALTAALSGCAPFAPSPTSSITYPDDLGQALNAPPERVAAAGDTIWLNAQETWRRELDGVTLAGRDPRTGQMVTREIRDWREAGAKGKIVFFAPRSYFEAPAVRREGEGANMRLIPISPQPADLPPPYACMVGGAYWQPSLTWSRTRCRPGRTQPAAQLRRVVDGREAREQTIRLLSARDGVARFAFRLRTGLEAPKVEEAEVAVKAPGLAEPPKTVPGLVAVQVVAIEGERVRYRLARYTPPCQGACIEE